MMKSSQRKKFIKILKNIINKIDPSWNKLQKTRFIYLELGKHLEKNTDYFLNDKLDKLSLPDKEMEDIYYFDKISTSNRQNTNIQYQVICKSASIILQRVLEYAGIESYLVRTPKGENDIRHWFLAVKGDNEEQYFLSLTADLPYIKSGLPTMHFANNLCYFSPSGEPNYILPNSTSLKMVPVTCKSGDKVYKGYEIEHTILTGKDCDSTILENIDKSIGYDYLYETEKVTRPPFFNKLFKDIYEEKTDIFNIFYESFNINPGSEKATDDITIDEINLFKSKIRKYVNNYLGVEDYSILLKNILNIKEDISLSDILKNNKEQIKQLTNEREKDIISIVKCANNLDHFFDEYIKLTEKYESLKKKIDDYKGSDPNIIDNFQRELFSFGLKSEKIKKESSMIQLYKTVKRLAYLLVKDEIEYKPGEYVTMEQVATRFEILFPRVFNCHFEDYEAENSTSFSVQNYSEQIVIVKMMLRKMFNELSENNCEGIEDYDKSYSPIENRIRPFPLKDKETGEYCIGFRFASRDDESEIGYIYIPSLNLLRRRNPLIDQTKYWIVSERFNEHLSQMEEFVYTK